MKIITKVDKKNKINQEGFVEESFIVLAPENNYDYFILGKIVMKLKKYSINVGSKKSSNTSHEINSISIPEKQFFKILAE